MEDTVFYKNQKLIIPQLSQSVGLTSYEFIVENIFQGGMGTCIKICAFDGSIYALKIIHSSLLENEVALNRSIQEMKTWLTLSACNGVVEAIVITRVNEIPCIVSNWMQNGDLCNFTNTVNPDFFYHTFDRIISTLDWSFSKYSIIHRDLKPANILLDNNKDAFIADWGLARPISQPNNENKFDVALDKMSNRPELTQVGQFMGTIVYASPEQIMGLPNIDHRSDIYSLGCMMYEFETGKLPFLAPTAQEIASMHLQVKPVKIGGFLKSTNYKIEHIITKCLEKDPNKRYQTYTELLSDFRSVANKNKNFKPFEVSERYKVPNIGENEFLTNKNIKGIYSQNGKQVIFEKSDVDPYFIEANNLVSLGEFQKAKDIYARFFNNEYSLKFPDIFLQIAVNYGFALYKLNKIDESIAVLKTVGKAQKKTAEYYLNLSLSYLAKDNYKEAENLCRNGLNFFPNDNDLIGNLTIALCAQDKLEEAQECALKRIKISRDVHSLEEAALILYKIAEKYKNTDFPTAVNNYKLALSLLQEAKGLNPLFTSARYSLANILFKLKKYDKSSEELSEINKIEKGVTEIGAFYMARNLLWSGAFDSGIAFCEKWLQSFPNSVLLKRIYIETMIDGYLLEGKADAIKNSILDPLDFLNGILKDEKNRKPSDFYFLAKIYKWLDGSDNVNYALNLLNQGIKLYPNYWPYYFYLANYLQQYNQLDDALEVVLYGIKLAPCREKIHSIAWSIYNKLGDTVTADKYKQEYIRLKEEKERIYENL